LCVGLGVEEQCSIDDVGESTLEGAERLGLGVASGAAAVKKGAGVRVVVGLGDGDAVDRGVELPVAGPAEPVPNTVARPDRQRRGPVVSSVGVAGSEPGGGGGVAQEFWRRG